MSRTVTGPVREGRLQPRCQYAKVPARRATASLVGMQCIDGTGVADGKYASRRG